MARKNIREEILNTARRLFNQRSYSEVSMRDIADALKISVGNLTYHFARKEDIVEAVVEEMHRYYVPLPPPEDLPQFNAILARMQNNILQNAFYFWYYPQLSQVSPAVHQMQRQILANQYDLLASGFATLRRKKLMLPEPCPGHNAHLAQVIQLLCIHWVPQSQLEKEMDTPKDFLDCVWSVLLPLLTEKGRELYAEKVVKVRMEFE